MTSVDKRAPWDDYFMGIAEAVSARATCAKPGGGVGAVFVRDRQILATGYNGSVRGTPHCTEAGCLLDERGKCIRTVHAEMNALVQAAEHGSGIAGATLYCTRAPCWNCFKALANGGVVRVVFARDGRDTKMQTETAAACRVSWEQHKPAGATEYDDEARRWKKPPVTITLEVSLMGPPPGGAR